MHFIQIIITVILTLFTTSSKILTALESTNLPLLNSRTQPSQEEKSFIINALTLIASNTDLTISQNAKLQLNNYRQLTPNMQLNKYKTAFEKKELIFFLPFDDKIHGKFITAQFLNPEALIKGDSSKVNFFDAKGQYLGFINGNQVEVDPSLLTKTTKIPSKDSSLSNSNEDDGLYPYQYEGAKGPSLGSGAGF